MLSSSVPAMKLSPEDVGLHELVKRADIMLLGLFSLTAHHGWHNAG